MQYQVKPKVPNPAIAESKKKKREAELAKQQSEATRERQYSEKKDKHHTQVVSSIDRNTDELKAVLEGVRAEIQKIEFDYPENNDGALIVASIESNISELKDVLDALSSKVSEISIEIPEVDMAGYGKVMSTEMKKNTQNVKQAIEEMTPLLKGIASEIKALKFETVQPPTEWIFDMVRDSNGFLKQIKASAPKPKLNS